VPTRERQRSRFLSGKISLVIKNSFCNFYLILTELVLWYVLLSYYYYY
jgi:hypothetical protein